jgi:hypothetical protein
MAYQNGEGAPHWVDSGDAQECVGWRARPISNKSDRSETQPLSAELTGANTCTAGGITARGTAPALILCQQLLAQGLDPDTALAVFRNGTLALRIRSIGEAAELEINSKGTGFLPTRAVRTAPPVRQKGQGVISVAVPERAAP